MRGISRLRVVFAVLTGTLALTSIAPALAGVPETGEAPATQIIDSVEPARSSASTAPAASSPADASPSTTDENRVAMAPVVQSTLSIDLQAISATVAPAGQAAFRAIATTGADTTGTTFTATLPAGVTYDRTLGVTRDNEAATNTVTTGAGTVTWSNIASNTSTLPAGSTMEVLFVVNAPVLAGPFSLSVTVTGSGSPSASDSASASVTTSALTLELADSPFAVADSNETALIIPRVATIGVRAVNPTLSEISATINIGDGTTPGTFPGASGPDCASISGGMALLALEKHGAAGAASDAARSVAIPAGQSRTVFYSLCYPGEFFQRHSYVIWSDAPGSAPANGALMTQSNLSASSNKILSVAGGRSGDVITLTVDFNLGTIGAIGAAWVQPVGTYGFDPLVSRLRSAQVTLNGIPQPADRLYFVHLSGGVTGSATYTFDVIGFGNTTLSPYILAASGQPLKFTGNFGDSQTILTPPNLTAAKEQRNYPDGTFTTDPINVVAGDVIEYRLTITNTGEMVATNVDITDPVPLLTSYVAGSANEDGALAGANVEWLDRTIPGGSSLVLTFRVQVADTVPLTFQISNQAAATSDDGGNPQTNIVVANGQGVVDLSIGKTCPTAPVLGEQSTYVLSYSNSGSSDATGVAITDTLGAGQSYVAGSTTGAAEPGASGQVLTFSLGTVAAGASGQITFAVSVTAPGTLSNSATIAGDQSEADTADNAASCSVAVTEPDLAITKACPQAPVLGEQATYTLGFSNAGTAAAPGATITDTLGAGQTYVAGSASGDFEQVGVSGNQITFTLTDPLTPGASGQISFAVTVDAPGQLANAASISGSRQEVVTANNSATCSSTVLVADLYVSKACPQAGVFGESVSYTLSYGNAGTASSAATLTDTLSAGQSYTSGSASAAPSSVASNPDGTTTLVWSLGELAPGAAGQITFSAAVTGTTGISNAASISGSRQETDTADNASSCATDVTHPDLFITKSCPQTANPDEVVTHTLSFGNSGTATAIGVTITDMIGSGQTYVLSSASAPVQQNGQTLTFFVADIPAGASGQITYQVRVVGEQAAGEYTFSDSVTIAGTRQETDSSNNGASCSTTVTFTPDLAIAKATTATDVVPGSVITYSIVVTNPDATSSAPATDVIVTDQIPAETSFQACSGASCSFNNGTVTWMVGTVGVGQTVTLTLEVVVGIDVGCQICNAATVTSPADPDSPITSAAVCIGVLPQGDPSEATGSGEAFGLDATILGMRPVLPAPLTLPLAATGSTQTGPGADTNAGHVQDASVPGIAAADTFATTSTSNVSATMRTSHDTSTATVTNLNLLDGAITADVVRAVVQTDASESSAGLNALGSTFKNLRINGEQVNDVTPNKRVALEGPDGSTIGYAVLFEQMPETITPAGLKDGTYVANLTVNMIHAFVGVAHPLGEGPATEIIVAHASGHADFEQAERCSEGAARSVGGHSFSMRALAGDGVEILKGSSGPIPANGGSDRQNDEDLDSPLGTLDVSRSGTTGSIGPASEATAFDQVEGTDLLGGLITASLLESRAHSLAGAGTPSSDADGTRFADLLVGGVPVAHLPEPNTEVIDLPGVGFVILNEQSTSTGDGSTQITVTAIHVVVTVPGNPLGLAAGTEIWISQAHTAASFAPVPLNLLPTL